MAGPVSSAVTAERPLYRPRPGSEAGAIGTYRYPARALLGDGLRATAGLLLCGVPLAAASLPFAIAAVLGLACGIFALFGLRAAAHGVTRITVNDEAILVSGWRRRRLAWRDLAKLSLAYYSTRRERGDGWMQLRLKGGAAMMRLESTLEGFPEIVCRAVAAAGANGLALDRATTVNLRALGIRLPGPRTP